MRAAVVYNSIVVHIDYRLLSVDPDVPGSSSEWVPIFLLKPSSLRSSTLDTRAAEHKGCNWDMQVD